MNDHDRRLPNYCPRETNFGIERVPLQVHTNRGPIIFNLWNMEGVVVRTGMIRTCCARLPAGVGAGACLRAVRSPFACWSWSTSWSTSQFAFASIMHQITGTLRNTAKGPKNLPKRLTFCLMRRPCHLTRRSLHYQLVFPTK